MLLWDTDHYLQGFDVITLTETRSTRPHQGMLRDFDVFTAPARADGLAGEGMLVAVRRSPSYCTQRWASDASTLWVKVTSTGTAGASLFIGACYLPPEGSVQLERVSLEERLGALAERMAAAEAQGMVVVAGDFNARVGTSPVDGPPPRGCTDPVVNEHGLELLRLCSASGFTLCTGRVLGDSDALPTFKARANTRPSRLDHILASAAALPCLRSCCVNSRRHDSDHHPLEAQLALPWAPRGLPAPDGAPLRRARWVPESQPEYAAALDPAELEAVCEAAAAGDSTAACDRLLEEVARAAAASGMPLRPVRAGAPPATGAHWFDAECFAAKRRFRKCETRSLRERAASKALKRRYDSVCRRKQRAWGKRRAQELLQLLRDDPRALYKRAAPAPARVPVALQQPSLWKPFVEGFARRQPAAGAHLPSASPMLQPHRWPPATELNAPFSEEEVSAGLHLLRNNRSPGASGLPAELLRYAQGWSPNPEEPAPHALVPALTALLNCWFRSGAVPAAANVSLVTPIHKRGDAAEPSNYRPIAVGEPLLRLYAAMLNARLVAYVEREGVRAPSQAGFRPQLSTVHQVFALQHLIDGARAQGRPLFCCFLDLKGAYDRVPRHVLWQALARCGVMGEMHAAIQSLYAHAAYAASVGGRRGEEVVSGIGVKQGCPLSPTLFGLLLDGLHWELCFADDHSAPRLRSGHVVPDLGYADDFCLLATSASHLQRLLDAAHRYLTAIGMEVSAEKSCVLVFGAAAGNPAAWTVERGEAWAEARGFVWTCGGQPLDRVQRFTYLGVQFSDAEGIAATFSALRGKLAAAWARLRLQLATLGDGVPLAVQRAMFQQAVPAAGSYCCEVWGMRQLAGAARTARARLAQLQVQLLRRLLRVRKSVRSDIVLLELCLASPEATWLRRTLRFWNTLAAAPRGSLHRYMVEAEWAERAAGRTWAASLFQALEGLGYQLPAVEDGGLPVVEVEEVMALHAAREQQGWEEALGACPRTCPSVGAHLCKYLNWFALPAGAVRNDFLYLPLALPRLLKVIQFRIGCHKLPIVAQQHQRVPREQRLCLHCDIHALGDEKHMLFECPATQAVRAHFAHLFPPGCTVQAFGRHPDKLGVAMCILACQAIMRQPPVGLQP